MKKSILSLIILSIGLQFSSCKHSEQQELKLNALFSDHMVLQQKQEVAFWGTYTPNEKVTVGGGWGEESAIIAGKNGNWKLNVPTPIAGGPYEVSITSTNDTIILKDVLIGEVWLASGQSNMQMPVKGWPPNDSIRNSKEEITNANYPALRMFNVKRNYSSKVIDSVSGEWLNCSPETVTDFSATAYFFARRLHKELNVPIGIIHSSWGGTPAESWTSKKQLKSLGDFDEIIDVLENPDRERLTNEWYKRWKKLKAPTKQQDWNHIDLGDIKMAQQEFKHDQWNSIALPGRIDFHNEQDLDGAFWFRKSIELTDISSDYLFEMGPVDDIDVVYFNGERIGGTVNKYGENRAYTISKSLLKKGKNSIAIRIIDTGGPGSISGSIKLSNKNQDIKLEGDWKFEFIAELYKNELFIYDLNKIKELKRPNILAVSPFTPSTLYNAMIHPLVPYSIKGAIWYQGESNVGRAEQYSRLFPKMINDWRNQWKTDFPFYFVQIAPYNYGTPSNEEGSMDLRDAQRLSLKTKNTGMVVTMDIGDFMNIHPANKQDVGSRLAGLALTNDYNMEAVASGPLYKTFTISGNKLILEFDHIGSGLTAIDSNLEGFEIAGTDKKYVPATAKIIDNNIELFAATVPNPAYARYAWSDNGVASLFNKEGLPASSFTTE
jgi:sialate O-acetylesterase